MWTRITPNTDNFHAAGFFKIALAFDCSYDKNKSRKLFMMPFTFTISQNLICNRDLEMTELVVFILRANFNENLVFLLKTVACLLTCV